MANTKSEEIRMLEVLIDNAASGKAVDLNAKPVREVVKLEREGHEVDTVILSMEYSGISDGKPFMFKKNYSFAEDDSQYALECLLIANNRLQIDHDRLKEAGINVKGELFTLQNSFFGLSGDASAKRPALRLQDFIHLSRAGISVIVDVALKRPATIFRQEGVEKRGFGSLSAFVFTVGEEKTSIEKLNSVGSYEDTKGYQAEIRDMANKRLERDCERLRRAGMKVAKLEF